MFRICVEIILVTSLLSFEAPRVDAQVLDNKTEDPSSKWLAALANSETDFVMRSSQTRNGNGVISLDELHRRHTIPEAAWKQYRRALTEDDRGHYSESFRLAMSAVTLWPAFPQAHGALAVSYLRSLDLPNAEREIRTASNLDTYYLPARDLLGIFFFIRGNWSDARKTLEAVVAIDFTRGMAQYFLARSLSALGEPFTSKQTSGNINRSSSSPSQALGLGVRAI